MPKRFSDTEIWAEDWFLDMPPQYQLFWFYILAKCDHTGVFKVNLRSFRGLIEGNLTSNEALKLFNNGKNRIRVVSENLWFIEDFIVYQYGTTLNLNNRLHESIANGLTKNKIDLTSIRGLLDLKDRVKDKDKVKDKEIQKGGMGENKNGTDRAIRIDELQMLAFFPDGSSQPLDMEQERSLKAGKLEPHYVRKVKSR